MKSLSLQYFIVVLEKDRSLIVEILCQIVLH